MSVPLLTVTIEYEQDVVAARQRARQLAALLGFESQDQTRIATAVSEIARNAFAYAGGGKVEFSLEGKTAPQLFTIQVVDQGPGIRDLPAILEGRYKSTTGMGLGLIGVWRLMDSADVTSSPAGTSVFLRKLVPSKRGLLTADDVNGITAALAKQRTGDALGEIRNQNQELLRTLEELRRRQVDLERLNRELEDTNRGVVALYAELNDRADHLRRADELKTKFLSNMTHEFRTPVNSILALASLLRDRADGELNAEQDRQVGYISKAAKDLSELINDLLDLAKVEAGKTVVRTAECDVGNLFGGLRGMLRPLLAGQSVALVFEETSGLPAMMTDESKVSQILRNLISNALKFTEQGEVRVKAAFSPETDRITFAVSDTGIGIRSEDLDRIFEEFGQLDNPIQRRVKGTGLGLPLSRRLTELLGGRLTVTSRVGKGSTFLVELPRSFASPAVPEAEELVVPEVESGRLPVLAVEDMPEDALVLERLLRDTPFQLIVAKSVRHAREILARINPRAILLDILLGHEDAWSFLAELKSGPATNTIPVVMVTSIEDQAKAASLGANAYGVKPLEKQWLLSKLEALVFNRTALIVDDDEPSRYALSQMVRRAGWEVLEASSGPEGLALALSIRIGAIFLDVSMPQMDGFEVLRLIRGSSSLHDVPVFISSAATLTPEQDSLIRELRAQVMPKSLWGPAGVAAALRGLAPAKHPDDAGGRVNGNAAHST